MFIAYEFCDEKCPVYGNKYQDDRPFGVNGEFIVGSYHNSQVKRFADYYDAYTAALHAPNRRQYARLSVIECKDD